MLADWDCVVCHNVVWGSKDECPLCLVRFDDPPELAARLAGELRQGDWYCRQCDTLNFARRASCFNCNKHHPYKNDCQRHAPVHLDSGTTIGSFSVIARAPSRSRSPAARLHTSPVKAPRMRIISRIGRSLPETIGPKYVLLHHGYFCDVHDFAMLGGMRRELRGNWYPHVVGEHSHLIASDWRTSATCNTVISDIDDAFYLQQTGEPKVNLYLDGACSKNYHRDSLGNRNIAIIASFGAQRDFVFSPYNAAGDQITITLKNGSLCAFCIGTNTTWVHGLPQSGDSSSRISIVRWGVSPLVRED